MILQAGEGIETFIPLLVAMFIILFTVTSVTRLSEANIDIADLRSAAGSRAPGVVGLILLSAILVGVGWFLRPWLHGIVYLLYRSPLLMAAVLILGAGFIVSGFGRPSSKAVAQGLAIVLVLALIPAGWSASVTLNDQTFERSQTADRLIETSSEQPRVVPRAVANRYASNTLNLPRYRLGESDITMRNGTPYWTYPLSPDGFRNYLFEDQDGTVFIDMTSQNIETRTVRGQMQEGIGTVVWNRYKWHLLKNGQYLVDYQDPFMVVHDEQQYIAVPYVKPQFHVWYTTPKWGGVALIHEDGTVEDLSPEQAREHPVLEGQRLYPFALALREVSSTRFRNGVVNQLPAIGSHEDEIEIAPVPGSGNSQPFFVLDSDNRPHYFVAVEPYGEAQGLREVWTVDARTGSWERYSPSDSLTGPRKAADYVRQAARTTDWDRFNPSEPIPTVVNGRMYWSVRVVPTDASGISYLAFVDAQSTDVIEAETSEQISAFLAGKDVDAEEQPPQSRQPTMVIQRVAENGTVIETMEIYGNETVVVMDPVFTNSTNTP